jgi:hypothetical protein
MDPQPNRACEAAKNIELGGATAVNPLKASAGANYSATRHWHYLLPSLKEL